MKSLLRALLIAGWLATPWPAAAASISGILIYSTVDDSGTPVCWVPDTETCNSNGQLWGTLLHHHWYGLGVLAGLPTSNLQPQFLLNAPDFSLFTGLIDGENDFTLVGAPGPQSESDAYERFALNIFFDGVNDRPGISVVFQPRRNITSGMPPEPNRSDIVLSLDVRPLLMPANSVYDDGVNQVSVMSISFGEPQAWSAELVGEHALIQSNISDWGGILKVMVEPSTNPGAQPVRGPGAAGFGVVPGGIPEAVHGPDLPIGGAGQHPLGEPGLGRNPSQGDSDPGQDEDVPNAAGEGEPTAPAEETATPGGTLTPRGTLTPATTTTPHPTSATVSPTPGSSSTASPPATALAATPMPRQSTTAVAATPTPAARRAKQPATAE